MNFKCSDVQLQWHSRRMGKVIWLDWTECIVSDAFVSVTHNTQTVLINGKSHSFKSHWIWDSDPNSRWFTLAPRKYKSKWNFRCTSTLTETKRSDFFSSNIPLSWLSVNILHGRQKNWLWFHIRCYILLYNRHAHTHTLNWISTFGPQTD